MSKADEITMTQLRELLNSVKASTGDPSIFITLRPDGSGAVESGATKQLFAVWLDPFEFEQIWENRAVWPKD